LTVFNSPIVTWLKYTVSIVIAGKFVKWNSLDLFRLCIEKKIRKTCMKCMYIRLHMMFRHVLSFAWQHFCILQHLKATAALTDWRETRREDFELYNRQHWAVIKPTHQQVWRGVGAESAAARKSFQQIKLFLHFCFCCCHSQCDKMSLQKIDHSFVRIKHNLCLGNKVDYYYNCMMSLQKINIPIFVKIKHNLCLGSKVDQKICTIFVIVWWVFKKYPNFCQNYTYLVPGK
jgi:hypothetical protein